MPTKSRMQKPKYEPIEVFWLDSVSDSGWKKLSEVDNELEEKFLDHRTIGYYIKKTKRALIVAQSYGEYSTTSGDKTIADTLSIPLKAITRIRKVFPVARGK